MEEDLLAEDSSVGAVPQKVADRMMQRIAVCFGVPVFGGLSVFAGAVLSNRYLDYTVPPVVIAYATQAPFVLGLVGISYAIISTSWDEVRNRCSAVRLSSMQCGAV